MDKPPYFPLYVQDFSSDGKVEAMTTTQVGAYTLLLCKSWHEDPPGTIPSDDRTLARWTRLTADEWTDCKPGVLAAFTLGTDNRYHQKRLRQEYQKLMELYKKKSTGGKEGAKKRWESHKTPNGSAIGHPMGHPMPTQCHSESDSESFNNRYKAPSLEEVLTYSKTIEMAEIDAKGFHARYQSQGWVSGGGLPITDWKSKCLEWHYTAVRKRVSGNRSDKAHGSSPSINSIAQCDSVIADCYAEIKGIKDRKESMVPYLDQYGITRYKLSDASKKRIQELEVRIQELREMKRGMK